MRNPRHVAAAREILAERPDPGTYGTAHDDFRPRGPIPGVSVPTNRLIRRAALDLGQSRQESAWSIAKRPTRDAMGNVPDWNGRTVPLIPG